MPPPPAGRAPAGASPALHWTPHPLLPVPPEATLGYWLAQPGGDAKLAQYYAQREKLIGLSEQNPYAYGTEPDHWRDADALLALDILILMIFGGNRAGKSEYAAKRVVQDAVKFPESTLYCLHENVTASIALQHKLVWKYLPPEYKKLNNARKDAVRKINYSQANGFTDGKIVLPNASEIFFLTYGQTPGDFEGLELGAKHTPGRLGVWADENLSLPWLNMLKLRLASRSGKLMWTFTPVNGITPCIKELLGTTAKTVQSKFAELLPDRVNVPGLPEGHMPYVVEPYFTKARAIYFHSILNPFGNHYVNIRSLVQGKPSEYIERRAYGYSRDVGQRQFPLFGEWNIIAPENLGATGTNYMFTDPAGARNWATVWVRVLPGHPPILQFYRDWPSEQRYGEWAVASTREMTADSRRGWDGDPGPAQNSLGFGITQYKQLWLREETFTGTLGTPLGQADPYRVRLWEEAQRGSGGEREKGKGRGGEGESDSPATETLTLHEAIQDRYLDSRAARNKHASEKGGTCIADELARTQYAPGGEEVAGPPMRFRMASGVDIEEGVSEINELLFWHKEETMIPLLNAPRLYVSSECRQLIWAMQNSTGRGGESGACKDFIDLVRYVALARLHYLPPGGLEVSEGGSY